MGQVIPLRKPPREELTGSSPFVLALIAALRERVERDEAALRERVRRERAPRTDA